ncbi:MAG: rhomboid family intramembrane serine protease [Bacteroidales bacterium]|nr:rhomboid family intramembrane serine protease [Bacteroidales bacterium]
MTLLFIIITVIVSLLAFSNRELFDRLKFNAHAVAYNKNYYRFFSYGLLHADLVHLLINMFVLYSFGRFVESDFIAIYGKAEGIFLYVLLYIGSIAFSTLPSLGKHKDDIMYNAVGASGAVSAVIFASILIRPSSKIGLILLPIPIPSPVFGILFLIFSAYMARRGKDNIGHDAHFWGALFGFVFPILFKPELIHFFFRQIF